MLVGVGVRFLLGVCFRTLFLFSPTHMFGFPKFLNVFIIMLHFVSAVSCAPLTPQFLCQGLFQQAL